MERSEFIKKGASYLGMTLIAPALLLTQRADACTAAAQETAGPFPTINPDTLVRSNIIGTRTGVPFTINITVKNINNSCNAVGGVIVDIWHCDKDGYYSEYGGSGMQTVDYTSETFLRGRQTTDSNGLVTFTSIFPGWYSGRATHIHVHIYTADGTSLAISQIAFPEGTGSAVETVNASTANGYTKGMTGYTYNASDNVFSDGTSTEMGTVTGDITNGYAIAWDAYVSAPATTGIGDVAAESAFQIRQNYPNPATAATRIPVTLQSASTVRVYVLDLQGREISKQYLGSMNAGEQTLDLDISSLAAGNYIYTVKVNNLNGIYAQSRMFVKE